MLKTMWGRKKGRERDKGGRRQRGQSGKRDERKEAKGRGGGGTGSIEGIGEGPESGKKKRRGKPTHRKHHE